MARKPGASKYALLTLLIGVSLIVIELLMLNDINPSLMSEGVSMLLAFSGALLCAIWGFVIANVVTKRRIAKQEREERMARYLSEAHAEEQRLHTAHAVEKAAPPKTEPAQSSAKPSDGMPAALAKPRKPEPSTPRSSRLDFPALARELRSSPDIFGLLKDYVTDVYTRDERLRHNAHPGVTSASREAWKRANYTQPEGEPMLPPCPEELWLARQLEEAGLFDESVNLPLTQVVRPRNSHMLYLRPLAVSLSWPALTRIIEIEAALNRARVATTFFIEPHKASSSELMRFAQRFESSVSGQWQEVARISVEEVVGNSDDELGEWAFREAFSTAIETVQLPYRLVATFRSNLASGSVAIETDITPAEVFPKSIWSNELERTLPTCAHQRETAASSYAARVALLLAGIAFACSERVRTVFVAGVSNNGNQRSCRYSVQFDRLRFETYDLADVPDPLALLRAFGATVKEKGGALQPVSQGFALEDERFCPKERYQDPAVSARGLTREQAHALGCSDSSGLEINENVWRRIAANELMRKLNGTVENKVSAILSSANANEGVAEAAVRTAQKLISGEVNDEDPFAVEDEFVNGDMVSRAVDRAIVLIEQDNSAEASRLLSGALAAAEAERSYADEPGISRRYFNNYIERVLYNRSFAEEGARVELVPDAYFNAHLLLSSALYDIGDTQGALAHAERAHELDPLDERAVLRIVRCREQDGDLNGAFNALNALLRHAHTNETLGVGYYRMAFIQYQLGNHECSAACYRMSVNHPSSCAAAALVELVSLHGPQVLESDDDELRETLEREGVTVAPTSFVSHTLASAAKAATDAEIFPVARNLAQAYGALEGNDVLLGVIRSIEREPDR